MSLQPVEQVLLSCKNGDQRWRRVVVLGNADAAGTLRDKTTTPAAEEGDSRALPGDHERLVAPTPDKLIWGSVMCSFCLVRKEASSVADCDVCGRLFCFRGPAPCGFRVPRSQRDWGCLGRPEPTDRCDDACDRRAVPSQSGTRGTEKGALIDPKEFVLVGSRQGAKPAKAEPRPREHSGNVEEGEGRDLPVGAGSALSGPEVKIADKKHVVLGYLALGKKGDKILVTVWAEAEELAEALRSSRVRGSGHPSSRFEKVEGDIFVDPEATSKRELAEGDKKGSEDGQGLRVLMVHYENDSRRFRRLQGAQLDMEDEGFSDWRLQTEWALSHAIRELRRSGLSLLQPQDQCGVRQHDRSVHEHDPLGPECINLFSVAKERVRGGPNRPRKILDRGNVNLIAPPRLTKAEKKRLAAAAAVEAAARGGADK